MSGFLKRTAAKIAAQKKRIAVIALGHTFNQVFDWLFNYPLYLFVIEKAGLTNGYLIMVLVSFLTCLLFIQFYDWLKIDWLGIEMAKEIGDFGPNWIRKISPKSKLGNIIWWPFSQIALIGLWAINRGGILAFIVMSIQTDPFMTTVYMRKGIGQYNGLKKRDWFIFLSSTAVGNAYWAVITFAILESAKLFLKRLIG